MYFTKSRLLLTQFVSRIPSRFFIAVNSTTEKVTQIDFIKSAVENKHEIDWTVIKSKVLSIQGPINQKNIDSILLKTLITNNQLDTAISLADYIKKHSKDLSLGSTGGLLRLYTEISNTRKLNKEEKKFIQDSYNNLYDKHKILDFSTAEKLLLALCAIDDWEKALKVLQDIQQSCVPSHIAFSVLIGTLFRNKKKKRALEFIKRSLENKRALLYPAYNEWINYVLKNYKDNKTILKYLDEIFEHISRNYAVIDHRTALKFKETFQNLGWDAEFTRIVKINGQCIKCKATLDCLKLSDDEFKLLQNNIKDKLIVGSDLLLKTSPEELQRFQNFIERTGPYDIVIDALNTAYAVGKGNSAQRISLLMNVINYFKEKNKKILLLGRKHMIKWNRNTFDKLKREISCFFIENISQDDPYFITAAILSGPHTDILSKDLLRTHKFNLKDDTLQYLFRKWQWQHQWMIYTSYKHGMTMQEPLKFTPCAQKKVGWHLPFESEMSKKVELVNDGTPDLSSWLCIKPKLIIINKILH